MQTHILIGWFLAAFTVINAFLLGLIVLKQRKFDRQTNGGALAAAFNEIESVEAANNPEEQRVALLASCEHYRRAQMLWINEESEARNSGDTLRQQKARELAAAWGEVYVLSCAFYRRWEIRA